MQQVPALEKTIRLLEAVAATPGRSGAELSRHCGIPSASCCRILATLEAKRWIRHDTRGGWEIGTGIMPLVKASEGDRQLVELVSGPLARLVEHSGISAKASIREGDQQVIIHSRNANRPFTVNGSPSTSFSILRGSSGAALLLDAPDLDQLLPLVPDDEPADSAALMLARQDDCRRQGWCSKIGVHNQGIDGISAPVRDASGTVCCALTLLGLRGDMTDENLPQLGRAIRECVAECQLAITHHQSEKL